MIEYATIATLSQPIFCDNRVCDNRTFAQHLDMPEPSDATAVFERLSALGLTQNDLAAALGLEPDKVSKVKGQVRQFRGTELVRAMNWLSDRERLARAGYSPSVADQPLTRSADAGETAPVLRLDLSYSMGPGTSIDDSYIEGEAFQFDIGFLRGLTITPPDRLRIVDGIGTSMEPTLHDRDLLLIDINQRDLNAQDRVWACWIFGLGAVKRLRAVGPDRVMVISDNPDVENQEVGRADILIHGRVVGSIKRH